MHQVAEGPVAGFFGDYHIVDVQTGARSLEPAAMIPDARFSAIEVRQIMSRGGTQMWGGRRKSR